jgi:hypothetical protein
VSMLCKYCARVAISVISVKVSVISVNVVPGLLSVPVLCAGCYLSVSVSTVRAAI